MIDRRWFIGFVVVIVLAGVFYRRYMMPDSSSVVADSTVVYDASPAFRYHTHNPQPPDDLLAGAGVPMFYVVCRDVVSVVSSPVEVGHGIEALREHCSGECLLPECRLACAAHPNIQFTLKKGEVFHLQKGWVYWGQQTKHYSPPPSGF